MTIGLASNNAARRILDSVIEPIARERLGVALAHQCIARSTDQIVAQLHHTPILGLIEANSSN